MMLQDDPDWVAKMREKGVVAVESGRAVPTTKVLAVSAIL